MNLIDGKRVSEEIKLEIKAEIDELSQRGKRVPGLVVLLIGVNPASECYVNNKAQSCTEIGMKSVLERRDANCTENELLDLIYSYNENPEFDGILVQLPLPKHIDEKKIINAVSPKKDVDGFHPVSVGNLVIGDDTFFPCTPAGIQELLKRYDINPSGKHVVVVGRSNIVGKPIANMLFQKKPYANAVVTICHTGASDLSVFTRQADILIAAAGVPGFIKGDMVREGCVVIDVGINRVEDASRKTGYRLTGDVDFESVAPKSSYITPVPGGVGPMTIAMLLSNTLKSYHLSEKES